MTSVYFNDPDGNLIEISSYGAQEEGRSGCMTHAWRVAASGSPVEAHAEDAPRRHEARNRRLPSRRVG